jgi:hypothetical protein
MCGDNMGKILGTILLGPIGYVAGKKLIDDPAKSAKRNANAASAALNTQEAERKNAEEIKRKQRKATDTVLTSGQGLSGTSTGVSLG